MWAERKIDEAIFPIAAPAWAYFDWDGRSGKRERNRASAAEVARRAAVHTLRSFFAGGSSESLSGIAEPSNPINEVDGREQAVRPLAAD